MKKLSPRRNVVKAVRERFFLEFSECFSEWIKDLVSQYKERGIFPIFPTQIIEYYQDQADKDVSIFAALCMRWNNRDELTQVAAMREILGAHPYEWFANREFVMLSTGKNQFKAINGFASGTNWKVARCYDLLYDACRTKDRKLTLPSQVFIRGKFDTFCNQFASACHIQEMRYKGRVAELVLRTSDGIGRGVWGNTSTGVQSPMNRQINKFTAQWFPWLGGTMWTLKDITRLFRLEHSYDWFYFWLAYEELKIANPAECKRFAAAYARWLEDSDLRPRYAWYGTRGILPKIKFKNYE